MAGNGVVLKPASLTPLIGERIQSIFEKAGFPEGLVRTVHGGGRIGDALVKSSARKIFFTGSVEVGYKVGVECAKRMKGSVLELGGKDPADRLRRRRPRQRDLAEPSGAGSPTAARPARASSASTSTSRSPTSTSRASSARPSD